MARERQVDLRYQQGVFGAAAMVLMITLQESDDPRYGVYEKLANPDPEPQTLEGQIEADKTLLYRAKGEMPDIFLKVVLAHPEIVEFIEIEDLLGLPPGFALGEDLLPLF